MKSKIIFFLLFVWGNGVMAQSISASVIASTGIYSESGNLQLSSTVGELAIQTLSTANLILTQGFQQPLVIGTGVPDESELDWEVKTWPNPVYDQLNIAIRLAKPMDLILEVYDLSGKKVWIKELNQIPAHYNYSLNFSRFVRGIYFLKIQTSDKKYNRIIKLQKQ